MKYNKTITIDKEILEELNLEKNASRLINQLLKDYFTLSDIRKLPQEKIDHRIKLLKQKEDIERELVEQLRG